MSKYRLTTFASQTNALSKIEIFQAPENRSVSFAYVSVAYISNSTIDAVLSAADVAVAATTDTTIIIMVVFVFLCCFFLSFCFAVTGDAADFCH